MKLDYYADTDTLYIKLKDTSTSTESEEVADGIVLDFDAEGGLVGIELDPASKLASLAELRVTSIGETAFPEAFQVFRRFKDLVEMHGQGPFAADDPQPSRASTASRRRARS